MGCEKKSNELQTKPNAASAPDGREAHVGSENQSLLAGYVIGFGKE